jgi:CheY-like chemotaxis protein
MGGSRAGILLVEDDENDILLMGRAFDRMGIKERVAVVRDGEAAIGYLQGEGEYSDRESHPLPLLMLLDLKLPRRSGLEVLAWARQAPGVRHLPIIVLTSSRETLDLERAYELGANSYLVKPPDFDQLKNLVRVLDEYWLTWNATPENGTA